MTNPSTALSALRLRPGALLFQTSRLGVSINLALDATGRDEVVLVDADI